MKILLVQEYDTHREIYVHHLAKGGHQVDCFLPRESIFEKESIPFFKDPQELADLVKSYDAAMLDRETFRRGEVQDGSFVDKYVQALAESQYSGKIVIDSSLPGKKLLKEELGENLARVTILIQPFMFEELDEALGLKK